MCRHGGRKKKRVGRRRKAIYHHEKKPSDSRVHHWPLRVVNIVFPSNIFLFFLPLSVCVCVIFFVRSQMLKKRKDNTRGNLQFERREKKGNVTITDTNKKDREEKGIPPSSIVKFFCFVFFLNATWKTKCVLVW